MKKFLSVICAAVFCFTMVACSGKSGGKTSDTGNTKITVSHCQGEWCWPILEKIADEFEKETGTEVEFLYVASDSYNQWQEAQLAAGNEPDIIWGMTNAKTFYKSRKIMPLTSYYNEKSEFSGNVWKDDYIDGILEGCYDETGEELIANVILRPQVNLYYNKTIFNELGLEVPTNWTEVIKCCEAIKNSGKIPFSVMNSSSWSLGWLVGPVTEDCYITSGKADKLDIISKNGRLDQSEILLGLKTGVLKYTDEEFKTYFKLMKELTPYFNKGYNSVGFEFESLFNEGKVGMTLNGSWYPNQHITGKYDVDYGVALIPYVDADVYKNSRNQVTKYMAGAPTGDIVVTQKAKDENRADAAVKFLQFLSDAQRGGKTWVAETMFLPVIKNVELPEVMKPFEDFIGTTTMVYNASQMLSVDNEAKTEYEKKFSEYLENNKTPDEFAAEVQKLYEKYIDDAIEMSEVDIKSYIGKVKK